MNSIELSNWEREFPGNVMPSERCEVDGVSFVREGNTILAYRYGNARGLVFADNFFNSPGNYEPGCRISPLYSGECKFHPLSKPSLPAIASAVKASWEAFTKG